MKTAKVFWTRRSQVIRLPKEFRFEASEVRIRRYGSAAVLEPIAQDWQWLDKVIGPIDDDFARAATEQHARP